MATRTESGNNPGNPVANSLILVADDDLTMRMMISTVMQGEGYKVLEASNGKECLAAFKKYRPDLVLLDAKMPEMDGFATCAGIRDLEFGKQIPVLMITGLDDDTSVDKAFGAGTTDYITKPIHWAVLCHRVNRLLTNQQLVALRDDLTHMIIHDMKNPAWAIQGYAELLLSGEVAETLTPKQARFIEDIEQSSQSLLRLTRMILDLKKMEEGKLLLERSPDSVRQVLEKVVAATIWQARPRQINIAVDCPDSTMIAELDWNLIERVLINLISNAIKHSPRNSTVILRAECTGPDTEENLVNTATSNQHLRFSVKDQGEGIDPGEHSRIFEKFSQASQRLRGSRNDSGLGLTFCKLAVEAHGGTIHLESAIGQGATFTLSLPRKCPTGR